MPDGRRCRAAREHLVGLGGARVDAGVREGRDQSGGGGGGGPDGARAGELVERPGPHEPAAGDDDDVVHGLLHLRQHVAGHQDRPSLGGQRPQERAEPHDALGVQTVRGLVEHEHGRVGEQRLGETEPLAHAETELPDAPVVRQAVRPTRSRTASTRRSSTPAGMAATRRLSRAVRPAWKLDASSSAPTSPRGCGRST